MATQEYAASIQGVSIRVTRLDAAGNLLNNAGDSYTTSAFMRISFTPEYEEGDEITEKSANGAICVSYKAPDTLKRITMELAICEPDPELSNLISGGLLLRKNLGADSTTNANFKSIGWASPNVGDDPAGNGVAIECWSFAVKDGKRAATLPYFHWVFPYVRLRQSGDRVIENGMLATTFEGYGLGNDLFDQGLDDRWEFPTATERPYSYARASWAPTGRTGFYEWHPDVTKSVTVVARTAASSTATITAVAHGFRVGDSVTLTGASIGVVAGTYTVVTVPSVDTFTITTVATTAIAAGTGTALLPAGSWTVSTLPNPQTAAGGYNVPGGIDYNADLAIDYIIPSVEDPA
jgi:hypothetical protein